MDNKIATFQKLAQLFNDHGFELYLVGGSVRDYLLGKELTDMDVATNALVSEQEKFLPNLETTFKKYGSSKLIFEGVKFDITTFRKESEYVDSRHPSQITFVKSVEEDAIRRDLSINALYLSKDLKVVDLVNGVNDLNNKVIRLIGEPNKRIKEDPLRIIRILRFKLELNFEIEEKTFLAIESHISLLEKLNKDKIRQEIDKSSHKEELKKLINNIVINKFDLC